MNDLGMEWLDQLNLSVRARNALLNWPVRSFSELCSMTEQDLMRMPQCGRISTAQILAEVKRVKAECPFLLIPAPPKPDMTRIADALERIASALERRTMAYLP